MYGAFLGDMIGAPFEFDRGNKTKDFPMFGRGTEFTDDSVMTVAVAEALMEALKIQEYKIKFMGDPGLESCLRITLGRREQTQTVVHTIKKVLGV